MATPFYTRSLVSAAKRLRISPPAVSASSPSSTQSHQTRHLQTQKLSADTENELAQIRMPRAVQATYMLPLKREPTHGIPSCNLQLRSYSVRNLEVFTDFALRAAYFLNLPASGPVPLPKITERWTVPRSNFIFKKSQENFERITMRRLIQIKDGHPDTVSVWLAFLRKYKYYGVGMKANVFEHGDLDATQDLDAMAAELEGKLGSDGTEDQLPKLLEKEPFKAAWGAYGPMSANQEVPKANRRMRRSVVGSQADKLEGPGARKGAKATESTEPGDAAATAETAATAKPEPRETSKEEDKQ